MGDHLFNQAEFMIIAEKMKQDWNERAHHHARFWIATENYQTEELFAQSGKETARVLMATLAELHRESCKILDIGCGIGRVLKALAPHFHQLVGVDVSSAMIVQSKKWLADCPHIRTYETSGVDLKIFQDSSFDLVYSYVTFQHMPRPVFKRYLGEINRILTPNGYLAFQLPIGHFQDPPLEDTIGIRTYPVQEIEESLQRNGFQLVDHFRSGSKNLGQSDLLSHRFHLAQKFVSIRPVVSMEWIQLERPHFVSDLDNHLYAIYADNCAEAGHYQEGIRTLKALVEKSPEYLAGWLRLASLLIETGQLQQALCTLKDFTSIHSQYHPGQRVFNQLLQKYSNPEGLGSPTVLTGKESPNTNRFQDDTAFTERKFSST